MKQTKITQAWIAERFQKLDQIDFSKRTLTPRMLEIGEEARRTAGFATGTSIYLIVERVATELVKYRNANGL